MSFNLRSMLMCRMYFYIIQHSLPCVGPRPVGLLDGLVVCLTHRLHRHALDLLCVSFLLSMPLCAGLVTDHCCWYAQQKTTSPWSTMHATTSKVKPEVK